MSSPIERTFWYGRTTSAELGPPSVDETDVLAHHDRVEGLGQGITGVDNLIGVASKYERRVFAYPDGVASPHGDPVHGGSVERGATSGAPRWSCAVIRPAAFPMGTSSVSTRFWHEASTHAAYQSSRCLFHRCHWAPPAIVNETTSPSARGSSGSGAVSKPFTATRGPSRRLTPIASAARERSPPDRGCLADYHHGGKPWFVRAPVPEQPDLDKGLGVLFRCSSSPPGCSGSSPTRALGQSAPRAGRAAELPRRSPSRCTLRERARPGAGRS